MTNNHVIKGAEDILVRVNGDKEYKAKIIGADPLSDIAVLQIESKDKLSEWCRVLYYGAKKEFSSKNGPFLKIY